MNLRHPDWSKYKLLRMSDPDAAERGRLMTAHKIASSSEDRQRMEDEFGVDVIRQMYPEAYRGGFARLLDRVRDLTPW